MNSQCANLRQPEVATPVTGKGNIKGGVSTIQTEASALPLMTARIIDDQSALGPDDSPMPMELNDGDTIDDSNFCQPVPTLMFTEYQNLTFTRGNLLNVQLDPACGHVVDDCLWIEKSFCSHLHPELVANGLPECDTNCQHQSAIDPTRYHDIVTGRHIGCAVDMDMTEIPEEDQLPKAGE